MVSQVSQKIKQEAIFWMARRLPTCKQLAPWVSESLERRLTLRRRIILKLHLTICSWCERYNEQLHVLRSAVRLYASEVENISSAALSLSPEAGERIKRALVEKER